MFWNRRKGEKSQHRGASFASSYVYDAYLQNTDKRDIITEHTLSVEDVCALYKTDTETGLTETPKVESTDQTLTKQQRRRQKTASGRSHKGAFVDDARAKYGYNEVQKTRNICGWVKYICGNVCDFFTFLVWIGAGMCFLGYFSQSADNEVASKDTLYLGLVLSGVVTISSLFTFYQYSKSKMIINSFQNVVQPRAYVRRNGKFSVVLERELLPGDIVVVKKGDRVPADIRVFRGYCFRVDQTLLAGGTGAVPKNGKKCDKQVNIFEAPNLIFHQTYAVAGRCHGIVIRIGQNTVVSKVNKISKQVMKRTPIKKEIRQFRIVITILALLLGVGFGLVALAYGYTFIEAGIFMIGLIVANVPEALQATLSVAIALTAKRMSKRECLVRNLEAVETVGAVSVAIIPKTGVVTMKSLMPHRIYTPRGIKEFELSDDLRHHFDKSHDGWRELGFALALCSSAWFAPHEEDLPILQRTVVGDSTESGILKLYTAIEGDMEEIRRLNPKCAEIPFVSSLPEHPIASKVKNPLQGLLWYNLTIHELHRKKTFFVIVKGAPETIFKFCSHYILRGKTKKISRQYKEMLQNKIESLSKRGERVIAVCQLDLPEDDFPENFEFEVSPPNFPVKGYRFLGFVSLADKAKENVEVAIRACRTAGIRIIMTTGDSKLLARSIAEKVGIITEDDIEVPVSEIETDDEKRKSAPVKEVSESPLKKSQVLTGEELKKLSLDEICGLFPSDQNWEAVFARISPEQKLRVVEALQSNGFVVAVVGDDVNDHFALRKADVGVSLGQEGTDVSRENADMILMDDTFSSLMSGIEEGRLLFDNLKKFLVYTLSSNIPEVLPFLAFILIGIPLPLGSITILFIDIVSDLVPGISLAYEKPEKDIMKRNPRKAGDHLVNARMIFMSYGLVGTIQAFAGFFMYTVIMAEHGWLFHSLIGIRDKWENPDINDLMDSFRQEWSYPQRKSLEYLCHTGFFLAMVQVQWADLIIAKTRKISIFEQGMSNYYLDFAIVFETLSAICLIYIPGTPEALRLYALSPYYWIPALPYALLIWIFDEWRRYFVRKYPDGFIVNLTYY